MILSQFLLTQLIAQGERVRNELRVVYSRRLSVGKTQTMLLSLGGNPQTSPLYIHLGGEGHAVVWQVRFLSVFLYILLYYFQIYICNQLVKSIAFKYTLLCNYISINSTFLAYDSKLYYMAIDDLYNILLNKQCLLYANACFIQENKCSRSCIYCIQQ